MDAANQAGQHAIIYGERGVGKTSLANVISHFLQPFTSETIISARVNCYRDTTYRQIWEYLFREVGLPTKDEFSSFTLDDVFNTLRQDESRKLMLIVDEFDRIEDPDVDALFADTIKALSDFSLDTTLILVGVADDVDDLITEHESIDRSLVQIHLPRMPLDELTGIVRAGVAAAGMEVDEDAVRQICTVSLGLPHYVHALSLASGRAAIDNKRLRVERADVSDAIGTLVIESQQTVLRQFDLATASPRRQNFYSQFLLACALAETDDLGYFRAADVRRPYSHVMGARYTDSKLCAPSPRAERRRQRLGAAKAREASPSQVQILQSIDAAIRAHARAAERPSRSGRCRCLHYAPRRLRELNRTPASPVDADSLRLRWSASTPISHYSGGRRPPLTPAPLCDIMPPTLPDTTRNEA